MSFKHATAAGCKAYAERYFDLGISADNYRTLQDLPVSSIGIGTYLGENDAVTSYQYAETLRLALRGGINLVDTAINYRNQLSERVIGQVLKELMDKKEFTREEIVVCSKAGFIPLDAEQGSLPAREYFKKEYVETGLIGPGEVVAGCQCLSPTFLENQIQRSLKNLGLESLDVYYLHNPEMQLSEVSPEEFKKRMRLAFECMEKAVSQGLTRFYGLATWDGFRLAEKEAEHLDLDELLGLAREVGGKEHHFKVVQLPYNIVMPEALLSKNQKIEGKGGYCFLEAAESGGISVVASASIMQGRLSRGLPAVFGETFKDLETDAQRSLQFVRSSPGICCALVGMKRKHHLSENLGVMKLPRASDSSMLKLFEQKS